MGNPPWACLRKKDLGWDRGVESKKVVQHVYLVGAKSIYRVAEKDKEYLRDEEEKNQNTIPNDFAQQWGTVYSKSDRNKSYHNCWLWWHDGRSEPVWLYVICV